jgi:hypothetical protein
MELFSGEKNGKLLKSINEHLKNIERETIDQNVKLQAIFDDDEGCCGQVISLLKKILAGQGGNQPGPLKKLTFHIGTPVEK